MAPEVPNPFFNRILISGLTSAEELAETLGMFESASVVPTIEVSPGGISQTMSLSLFQKGFAQTEFRPVFLHQADCIEAMPPDLETRIVKSDSDLESFKDLYLEGWKTPPFLVPMMRQHISKWVQLPGWSMYLALLDDSPVACAILYCFEDIAYLADAATPDSMRGKGGQTALLHARALAAQQAQMRYVFSRADFGSVSQRNMERLGLRVSYTRSAWSKIA
ncbi:MAG: GNAT family N-acetyltransferase [Cyanobacteria bacterium]|nr:GNAT family N-acetyltransferase [Cyanobacteriota bacterium]